MGLAEARAAVDEERVDRAGRILSDRLRSRVGQLVRFADHERLEPVPRIENRQRQFGRWRRPERDVHLAVAFGVGDEMQVEMVRRHLVEDHPDLLRVVLANFGNEALGRDAYVDRVALLGEETSRSEPRLKLSPVNGLLQPVEDLLPEIHRAFTRGTAGGPVALIIRSFSTTAENPGLKKGRRR